mgnify:CR=1 FL=1
MIPVLYPANETAFTTNGLGGLPDVISIVVTSRGNSPEVPFLEMEYPVDGLHYSDLAVERIIYATPQQGEHPQPFVIERISRPINGVVTVYAPHVSVGLQKLVTYGSTSTKWPGLVIDYFLGNALPAVEASKWTRAPTSFSANDGKLVRYTTPVSMMDVLMGTEGSVLDQFGGEFAFDHWSIVLYARQGKDTGLEVRYGVNMSDMTAKTDTSELVTAVVPYWKGTVNEVDTVVIGDMCSASNASAYAYVRCIPLDVSQQFELEADQQPTQAQVTAKGQSFIDGTALSELTMSINVKYTPLMENRNINLCDTVRVVHPDLGVSSTAKVVETRYNTLIERYEELTIGTMRQTIVDTIARLLGGS